VCYGQFKRPSIARSEQLLLTAGAIRPNGSNGVNNVARRKSKARRNLGITCRAAAERSTRFQKFWAGSIVNSSVYTAATEK
jgi:hypothetical protein